jgi:Skp family chaperone for outer membrane proteins
MKFIVYPILLLLTLPCITRAQDGLGIADLRVCLMHSDDLMQESIMGKKIIADLEKMSKALELEIKKSQEELLKAIDDLQKKAKTMPAKALEKAQEHLVFLQQTVEAKIEEANKKMTVAYKAAQDKFNAKAKAAIAACIKKHEPDILLDVTHEPVNYLSKRAQDLLVTTPDITQEVIDIIDK